MNDEIIHMRTPKEIKALLKAAARDNNRTLASYLNDLFIKTLRSGGYLKR
jgi:hypothetical protein